MAILSNVNGKFAVDSTGAIQFSGSAGTSGYILRSNGNAAPTWVDSSTVIGGPYLPLTGGTLSGALAGTSATFSGTITGQANNNTFGTASASGRPLTVQGNSSGQTIRLKNTLGGDGTISATGTANTMNYSFGTFSTNALFIQNDGKIGIGTDLPGAKLDIATTGSVAKPPSLRISNAAAAGYLWDIWRDNTTGYLNIGSTTNGTDYGAHVTIKDVSGYVGIGTSTPNRPLTIQSNSGGTAISIYARTQDDYGFIQFWGYNQTTIWSEIAGRPSNISFYQNSNEVLRLGVANSFFPSGNVGIGNTSPRDKLTVFTAGSSEEEIALRLVNPIGFTNAGSGSSIIFAQDRNTGENIPMAKIRNSQSAGGTSCCGELIFSTAHSSFGGMIDKIQISSNGATTFKGAERPQIYLNSRYDYPNNPTFEANTFAIVAAKYIGTAPYEANRIIASNSTHLAFEAGGAERMGISNSGNVTKPTSCAFSASTTTPGFSIGTTEVKIAYSTENVDTNGNYDTTNYRFTAPVTGNYLIGTTNTCYISTVVTQYMAIYIRKNGVATSYRFRGGGVDNGVNDWFGMNGSVVIPLAQGDYIELWGYANSGSFQIVNTEGHFYGYLIG